MIRGTKQTWGNPAITGGLGIKEFNSPLEASQGVDHYDALAKYGIDVGSKTDLAKERIKAESSRYKIEKIITADSGGAEEMRIFDTKTRSYVESGSNREFDGVIEAVDNGSMTRKELDEYADNLSEAAQKRLNKRIKDLQKK